MLFITAMKPSGNSSRVFSTILISQEPSSKGGVGTAIYAISQFSVTSEIVVPLTGSWTNRS